MSTSHRLPDPGRRRALQALFAAGALAAAPTLSLAGNGPPDRQRFVFFILRGGMDGLAAVPAVGDPNFASARGPLAEFETPPLPLDSTFALDPRLTELHRMYGSGEALMVHAVGLAYRQRSHFDAQQALESGANQPYELRTGWLARALVASHRRGLAMSAAVPLVLRGPAEVDSWAPSTLPDPSADLLGRLEQLYSNDPDLSRALARARGLREEPEMAADAMGGAGGAPQAGRPMIVTLAQQAGDFLAQAHGPQAAVLELGGWDSHAGQNAHGGIARSMLNLNAALGALRTPLAAGAGDAWKRTVVVVVSEFGRTVAVNGTLGTDHGTGGAMFVLGGAVRGGRVIGDWPGLAMKDRYEGRDVRITTDVRSVLKNVLGDHLKVPAAALERDVFPNSAGITPLSVLA